MGCAQERWKAPGCSGQGLRSGQCPKMAAHGAWVTHTFFQQRTTGHLDLFVVWKRHFYLCIQRRSARHSPTKRCTGHECLRHEGEYTEKETHRAHHYLFPFPRHFNNARTTARRTTGRRTYGQPSAKVGGKGSEMCKSGGKQFKMCKSGGTYRSDRRRHLRKRPLACSLVMGRTRDTEFAAPELVAVFERRLFFHF